MRQGTALRLRQWHVRGVERGVREIPLLLALKGGAAGHGIPDVGTALNAAEVRAGEHCGFTSRGRMCTFVTLRAVGTPPSGRCGWKSHAAGEGP